AARSFLLPLPDSWLSSPFSLLLCASYSAKALATSWAISALMTASVIGALIAQEVDNALAEYEAHRSSENGDDSHESGSGRRKERAARECTYSDFPKCQTLNFKGIEGVIKFATCTLLRNALTWWNSNVKTVGHDTAYGMPWKKLTKIVTNKYCPRGQIKKLEIKPWNLMVKESDKVENYVGRLPYMIQGSVMASKPKTMQDAVEFATELMDQKIKLKTKGSLMTTQKTTRINSSLSKGKM
nr:hypothetical protein [Tanacetum cinerariifolium]